MGRSLRHSTVSVRARFTSTGWCRSWPGARGHPGHEFYGRRRGNGSLRRRCVPIQRDPSQSASLAACRWAGSWSTWTAAAPGSNRTPGGLMSRALAYSPHRSGPPRRMRAQPGVPSPAISKPRSASIPAGPQNPQDLGRRGPGLEARSGGADPSRQGQGQRRRRAARKSSPSPGRDWCRQAPGNRP